MALTSAPLSSGIGVNVKGIDLTRPLGEELKQQLRKLLDEHCIVLIRDQSLTEEQLPAAADWTLAKRGRPTTVRRELMRQQLRRLARDMAVLGKGEIFVGNDILR